MTNEIIAIIILTVAFITIPPVMFDSNLGYLKTLQGWCIVVAMLIGCGVVVYGVMWSLFILIGGAK